jgi:hypothetical protein
MIKSMMTALALTCATAAVSTTLYHQPALAQADNTVRVRGTVTAIDADSIAIQSTSGQSTTVKLQPTYNVIEYRPIALGDIKPNAYLAIASQPQADGSLRAISVVVFPESMRGLNEGTKGWDLTPGSRMTNATTGNIATTPDGRELTLTFKGETQKIAVPERAPVTTFAPTDKAKLKVGSRAVVFGVRGADGSVTGGLVGISLDGSLPPI